MTKKTQRAKARAERKPPIGHEVIRPDGSVIRYLREEDDDQKPVDHYRTVDTLALMLRNGSITKKINPKTGKTDYQDWIEKYNGLVARSKEDFVKHYRSKYGTPLPIWVAVELWDFGLLSTFYQGMAIGDKKQIAAKYGLSNWKTMASWLRTINHVRNIAAHHSRLWNKNLVDQPKMPDPGEIPAFDRVMGKPDVTSRVYGVLCILAHLMLTICPNSSWCSRLKQMIQDFPAVPKVSAADMGCPPDWVDHAFWS